MIAPVQLKENPGYGFAIGRVRALETTLLDRNRYDRLVRCRDVKEFNQALSDTFYGRFLEGGAVAFDDALAAASRENFDFLAQYALDPWLLELFRLPLQALELKTGLKRELAGSADRDSATAASAFAAAVAAARQDYEANHDPARVDFLLDVRLHELLLETAQPSPFMTGWLALHADLENLRTLVRVKASGGSARELEPALLSGGTLKRDVLLGLVAETLENMPVRLSQSAFHHYLDDGISQVHAHKSLLRMERLGREMELGFLRQSRYAVFGHEPLVAYYLLRENEQRNLRGLYAARVAGLGEATAQDLVAWVE